MVVSIPDPAAIGHDSRDGSKIIRRTISGSEREIFCRIRWTGERRTSSSRPVNDLVLLRDAITGFPDTPVTLAFMLTAQVPENDEKNPGLSGLYQFQ